MLGPRNMGAGTSSEALQHQQGDYFSYASGTTTPTRAAGTHDGYGHEAYDYAEPSDTTTPAKRLIAQYERMSSPPPRAHGSGSGSGSTTVQPLLREKSTKSRQYVYDYRTEPGGASSSSSSSNRGHAYLGTPVREREDATKRRHTGTGLGLGGAKKDKSPLRQSLRNLLSVIKKGAGGLGKRKTEDEVVGVPYDSVGLGVPRSLSDDPAPPRPTGLDVASSTTLALADSGPQPAARSQKKMVGTLLYLTESVPPGDLSDSGLPSPIDARGHLAWTPCTVTLDTATHQLELSSFTSEMQLVVHEISLSGCTDIKSLNMTQLSAGEGKLLEEASVRLEGELGKLKAFEIRFEGMPTKKFAAKSVRERAGWISAIWDVILPEKEAKRARLQTQPDTPTSKAPSITKARNAKPIESPTPRHLPEMSNLLTSSYSQRSLPPIPSELSAPPLATPDIPTKGPKKHPSLHLDIPPLEGVFSPSIYPPTSRNSSSTSTPLETPRGEYPPDSNPSTPSTLRPGAPISPSTYPATSRPPSVFGATSPSTSPSIANLSQLSMVRHRLAQIERNHSEISAQTLTRPSTPVTPLRSPGRSPPVSPTSAASTGAGAWARREAKMFRSRTGSDMSPLPTPRPMTPGGSLASAKLPTTRSRPRPKESGAPSPADRPSSKKHREPSKPQVTKDHVDDLTKRISEIKGVIGGESGYPTIHQIVLGLDHRMADESKTLKTMQEKMDELGVCVTDAMKTTSARGSHSPHISPEASLEDQKAAQTREAVLRAIDDVKSKLAADFPTISTKLDEVRATQDKLLEREKEKGNEVVHSNVAPSGVIASPTPQPTLDLKPILDKLEELKASSNASTKSEGNGQESKDDTKSPEHLERILALIQEDSNKQTLLSQQQADSVRYLNELNNWLETFVNNGTSQIQGLSVNIQQLCGSLGCSPQAPGPGAPNPEGCTQNLLNDIRQLVLGMQARDQNFASLQTAVHSLLEVLSASQAQMGAESQAIAGLIARQRHEQEGLLRMFTNEISGEIKGERLRFVEAMKEATAINVQAHVEHFKQELGREVMTMTEEVGRLHREKQHVENQISDLFTFYSKHKQGLPLQMNQMNLESLPPRHQQQQPRANLPRSSQYRPLPHPRRP